MKIFLKAFFTTLFAFFVIGGAAFGIKYFYSKKIQKVVVAQEEQGFVVKLNGNVLKETTDLILMSGQTLKLELNEKYSLSIVPNKENYKNNFSFLVDGERKDFFNETSLITAFDITQEDERIVFVIPEKTTLSSILQNIYHDNEITMPDVEPEGKIFTMIIKNESSTKTYYFNFNISDTLTVSIIDKIIF